MERRYRNLGYVLIVLIPLTFFGFYKTYFVHFPEFEKQISGIIHFHAIIASLWIFMLIIQPILIKRANYGLHKKIGKLSYLLFPILVISIIPQIIRTLNSDTPNFAFFPIADTLALILFYGLAIYHRRSAPIHMRYMIGTAIVFLGPTIGRIGPLWLGIPDQLNQNILYVIIYLILAGLIILDFRNRAPLNPYLVILIVWIVHQISFNLIF